ncbi:MAG: hypothetical protein BRD24_09650 [Halobacteriales archaeon SW_9_67_24]|nr:MAG: hypothetical protein BRD24_09650 [Halobacteriales archaeon SW_9_67_24]
MERAQRRAARLIGEQSFDGAPRVVVDETPITISCESFAYGPRSCAFVRPRCRGCDRGLVGATVVTGFRELAGDRERPAWQLGMAGGLAVVGVLWLLFMLLVLL